MKKKIWEADFLQLFDTCLLRNKEASKSHPQMAFSVNELFSSKLNEDAISKYSCDIPGNLKHPID